MFSGKVQDNLRESESGKASITNAKWFESSRPKDQMHNCQGPVAMDAMVSVPVGGPALGSCQDLASLPKGDLIQSYLPQVKEAAKRRRKVGSVSPASTPSPREVVMKRDSNQQQRNGYHGDRYSLLNPVSNFVEAGNMGVAKKCWHSLCMSGLSGGTNMVQGRHS